VQAAEAGNAAARDLLARHPKEAGIRAATWMPAYAMPGFVSWFQSGLQPPRWPLH